MRLATAFDEIAPLKDPRVQSNPGYLVLILLSRVVTRLGTLAHINPSCSRALHREISCSSRTCIAASTSTATAGSRDLSALPGRLRGGDQPGGGIMSYPSDRIFEEVAYIARYLHWPYDQVMAIDHRERQRWVAEIARTNDALNEATRSAR